MKNIKPPRDALGLAERLAIIVGGIGAAISAFRGWSPVILWVCAIGALVGAVLLMMRQIRMGRQLRQCEEEIKAQSGEIENFNASIKYNQERQKAFCETLAKFEDVRSGKLRNRRTPVQMAKDGIWFLVKYAALEVRALDGNRHEINVCAHQLRLDDVGLPTIFSKLARYYPGLEPRHEMVRRLDDYSSLVWLREDTNHVEYFVPDTAVLGINYKTPAYDTEKRRSLDIWKCVGIGPAGPNWNGIVCASSPDPNVFTDHHRRIFELTAYQIYTVMSACALLNDIPPDPIPQDDDYSQDEGKGSAGAPA